jgi:hypothetical protein
MATLERAKRYDLLRGVLRGPNPEGRALATLALEEAGELTADDRHTVKALAQVPVAIEVAAEDDMVMDWPSSRFFSRPRWPVASPASGASARGASSSSQP